MQVAIMIMAMLAASQEVGTISPGGVEAIGPKQDDPRAMCQPEGTATTGMLSPGRVRLSTSSGVKPGSENDPKAAGGSGGMLAIGPKQDDPRAPGVAAVGSYNPETDPQALACGKAR